jgi:hypothetical protein
LSAFLGTIQNLKFRTVVVSFDLKSIAVAYHPNQPSVTLPYFKFTIRYKPNDGVRATCYMAQICGAIAPTHSVVESLTFRSVDSDCWGSGELWHVFLQPFAGVKALMVDSTLTAELSRALHPNNGMVIEQLLPVLSELVVSRKNPVRNLVDEQFSSVIHARRLAGHSINLRVIQSLPPSLYPPPISWSFDTFQVTEPN